MASRAGPAGRGNPLGAALGLMLVTALVVAGFWPSFFANPAGLDPAHLAHGVVATSWMLLLIAQPLLIATGFGRAHRLIGRLTPLLLAALVATGSVMMAAMLQIPANEMPPPYAVQPSPAWAPLAPAQVELRLVLAAVDVATLLAVMLLYTLAMLVRDRGVHARLLGATGLLAMIPAVGRLFANLVPGLAGLAGALDPSIWLVEVIMLGLAWLDWRDGRRAWLWPLLLLGVVALEWAMWQAPLWPWFQAVAGVWGWQPAAVL